MRAYTHRFIAFVIQSLVILLLAFGLSFSVGHSLAQDVATDTPVPSDTATVVPTELPTVVPTDVPTEVPTDAPTDATTEEPTSVPTEAVTEQPTDATVTDVPTQSATQPPAAPVSPDLFTEDFQDGQTTAWLLTPGWFVTDEAGNKVLAATTPNEMATLSGMSWPYFTLSFRVRGAIQLNMASGGSGYQIKVASDGAVSLYKDGALLVQAAGLPPTDATIEPAANWHTVNLLAPGNLLAVKIDNFTPISTSDPTLVGMGPLMFGTAADNITSVVFDDLNIQRLDAPPPMPTVVPTTSGVVPIPTSTTVTAEPTIEATPEATVEATVEATSEATAEATAEATLEATAEATVEPVGLSEEALKKLPPELIDILQSYETGDIAGAKAAAADYFITTDQQQRINVTVWTTDEQAAAKIAGDITASDGLVTDALSIRLQAAVTLEGLVALANAPEVTLIEVPPRAVSTSNMQAAAPTGYGTGTEISEGVDTTGAAAWQNAGIKGAGVNIAVIDTGFGPSVVSGGEYACLGNTALLSSARAAGDTLHGLYMVQILCDMAPAAKVYMYKATDQATLQTALLNANNTTNKIIVIAMDLGASVSPGDGTGGGALFANGVYTAITNARAGNSNAGLDDPNIPSKIVIASAGNNTGRYATLNYTGPAATIPMTVYAGDTIHISWNDWTPSGTTNYTAVLSPDASGPNGNGFNQTFSAARPAGNAPHLAYTVNSTECALNTPCDVILTLTGATVSIIQVQVAGKGTVDSLNVGGNATVNANAGNIARPADSQDVIAVGAVCPSSGSDLFLDGFSSHGPVFTAGGGVPAPLASYTRDQVKPDLAGPTHVSTLNNRTNNQAVCDSSGFNGTSAAAAHIAGMAALLVSDTNSSMAAFDGASGAAVDAVQNYLQTHTIDNTTLPGFGVGFDMSYGAGYSLLGSPTYDLSQITTISTGANQLAAGCSSALYVGFNNPGSSQDGTLANPFIDINEALATATGSQCVVLLPGEYVSPIVATSTTAARAIQSYEAATSFTAAASNLWSVITAPIFIDSNDLLIDGFTAQSAFTVTYATGSGGTTIFAEALRIRSSNGTIIQNSTFSGFKRNGNITDSTNIQIVGNTFSGFAIPQIIAPTTVGPAFPSALLQVNTTSGGSASSIVIKNNIFQNNSIGNTSDTLSPPWLPALIGVKNARVDVFNNRFLNNTTMTMVGVNQWMGSTGGTKNAADEVRIVGNLFSGNTNLGPIIHLFQAPKVRFVNNTVVNNSTNPTDNAYDGYLVYGNTASDGPQIGDRRLEIHNNLFYNNGTGHPLVHNAGVGVGCESIDGGTPVRNNWFSPPMLPGVGNNSAGECVDIPHDPNPPTIKSTGTVNETITPLTFFGTAVDPLDPYRLRPTDPSLTNLVSGINTGDNQALIDMFGDPAYKSQLDLRGAERVVIGGNPNPTYTSTLAVDIGAYELGTPSAPVADPVPKTIPEDSATSVIFTLAATGGYTQAFTITSQPSEYDTNPTNACGGQPLLFTAPKTVTYCPPANFHTQYGVGNTNVPIIIGFSVEDPIFKPGQISTNTISLTITPVDDGTPTAPTFNMLSDYFTPISQQLTPAYQLSNFVLTGTVPSVDYPFTYAYGSQTSTDNANLLSTGGNTTVQILQAAFTAANTNGGKLLLNPVAGQQGYFSFTYTVTDRDGNPSTGNATIVILPTLAKEGIYDDASFNFAFNGTGWTPSFVTGAYNNTLHATSIGGGSGDSLEFPFTGSTVRFNMRGSAAGTTGTNTLKLAFKTNIGNGGITYQDYAATKTSIPSLVCTDSLNAGVPNGSSDVLNYSATGAAYTIICSGFPTGQVHSIRLTNNLNASAMKLDSAEVSAGVMTAGKSYQESSANITYTGSWTQLANASTLGGTWTYTNVANATFSFNIDNTVGRIIFYRATYLTGVYGSMNVYLDGNLATPIATINNNSSTLVYARPYLLIIASPGNHTITVKNTGSTYITLDQITTLSPAQTLSVGTYQESYPDLTYSGVWTTQVNPAALGGTWDYTNDATANVSFKVDSTVSRVTIYRTTYLTGVYGSMNVYIDNNLTTPIATISNVSSGLLFQQPYLFTIPTQGNHTITIKNVGATYSTLDQITLAGPTQTLTTSPGIYQESNPNLTYSGIWTTQVNTATLGGAWSYTNDSSASVNFKIDSSVSRIVIYATQYLTGVYGSMNVYLDGNLTSPIATINTVSTALKYAQPYLISIPAPGNHTVTIKNVGTTYGNIDQITLLGSPQRLSLGSYQETDFNLTYIGTWANQAVAGALGGARNYTNQNGASVSFKIDSAVERVVIYHSKYLVGVYGSMDVYLDNDTNPIATISNTGPSFLLAQTYVLNIVSPGDHTITIKNVGTTYSDIDQITLLPASTRLTGSASGTIYQENYIDLAYTGTWTSQVLSLAQGGSRTYTNQNGATVSFNIDNTVSRVIVYRSLYLAGVYGSMNVYIDDPTMTGQPIAVINNTSAVAQYGQPYMLTIASPGNHMITLRNVGTTYSDIDQITLLGPTQRLNITPGVYQETDFNMIYTGTWVPQVLAQALGGSRTYTNQDGATVSFDIDNTVGRVVIYHSTYLTGVYGSMNVYIDDPTMTGQPIAVINNTSAAAQYGQPYMLMIGSLGNHNITIKNVGTTYSDIDQITLLPPASRLTTTPGTYQENNVNLNYTGTWVPQALAQALGGSRTYTNQDGATVSFDIDNTVGRVVIYRSTYLTGVYGSMNIYIDDPTMTGQPIAVINNTSAAAQYGQPYMLTIASPANHTITLKNVGTTYSDIDQITLLGPVQRLTATPGTYQDNNTNLTYTGIWTSQVNASAFGGSWSYTNQNNASVSFNIDNSVSRIIIYRTTYLTGVYGSMQVLIDDVAAPESPMNFTSAALLFGQPFFLNIAAPGDHTITLKNVGTTYSTLDQITLLGPATALSTAGIYEENDPALSFTGAWTKTQGTGPSQQAAYYTYAQNASVSFSVTGTAFSIYRTLVPGAGTFRLTIDGTPQPLSDNSASLMWQQPIEFNNLSNTTHTVVITKTSPATDFIYFDAVRVIDPTAALTVGQYQNTYPGLTYAGTGPWNVSGASTFTTTTGSTLTFKFTGNGFGFVTLNPTATGTMTVSCKIGAGADVCADPTSTPANGGYAFYNLKQGTYDVIITYTGTGGLYIDRIFVLDTPPTVLQPGSYEDTDPGIVYSPNDLWNSYSYSAYSGGALKGTYQKGVVVQMRFNGNSLVLYQLAYAGSSSNLNLCVFLTDAAGNPTSVCSTFSQNIATFTAGAPIAFYGFGSGIHEVTIENRIQGGLLSIDRILVN